MVVRSFLRTLARWLACVQWWELGPPARRRSPRTVLTISGSAERFSSRLSANTANSWMPGGYLQCGLWRNTQPRDGRKPPLHGATTTEPQSGEYGNTATRAHARTHVQRRRNDGDLCLLSFHHIHRLLTCSRNSPRIRLPTSTQHDCCCCMRTHGYRYTPTQISTLTHACISPQTQTTHVRAHPSGGVCVHATHRQALFQAGFAHALTRTSLIHLRTCLLASVARLPPRVRAIASVFFALGRRHAHEDHEFPRSTRHWGFPRQRDTPRGVRLRAGFRWSQRQRVPRRAG